MNPVQILVIFSNYFADVIRGSREAVHASFYLHNQLWKGLAVSPGNQI